MQKFYKCGLVNGNISVIKCEIEKIMKVT